MASDSQQHSDTMRTIAHKAGLSEAGLDRIAKAQRVVPKMQATIAFVSPDVRQQVHQRHLAQPEADAMPAHLMPSYSLDRVASTKTIREGQPLRERADRLRTPLFESDGRCMPCPPLCKSG